ncbi:hypothetical protein T265_12194 [Opisthorchis viverrini]|uniref:Apple domain-containing protein n=1 Tax=Opisthorchis viverrini TaxID=6198 RepID=A0A074YVK0_OPIVI|nr:hypothetical protein T265_12194 [Opisthorchis viverrini]KER18678.1 hypothetical protein T265_12194 [Opisthorchis viverrini]
MPFQHDYLIPGSFILLILLLSERAHQFDGCKPVKGGHVMERKCKSGKFRWRVVENKMLKIHFLVMSATSVEDCKNICETFPQCGAFDRSVHEQTLKRDCNHCIKQTQIGGELDKHRSAT